MEEHLKTKLITVLNFFLYCNHSIKNNLLLKLYSGKTPFSSNLTFFSYFLFDFPSKY